MRVYTFTTGIIVGVSFSALLSQPLAAQLTSPKTPSLLSQTTIAQSSANIIDALSNADNFSILVQALETAGLTNAIADPRRGPLTIFAPTDAAFEALPDGALEVLLEPDNKEFLLDVLTYHAVPGAAISAAEVTSGSVPTLSEDELSIEREGDAVMIDDSTVVQPDIQAANGIIHGIDSILVPDSADAELRSLLVPAVPVSTADPSPKPAEPAAPVITADPSPVTADPAVPTSTADPVSEPAKPVRALW
ncbi:MAG: fasciclin domain-containing protein [Cyanobacteria bacterium P01_H01_bin.15]